MLLIFMMTIMLTIMALQKKAGRRKPAMKSLMMPWNASVAEAQWQASCLEQMFSSL